MSAGQQCDLAQAGAVDVTAAEVTGAAAGKTGEQCVLFARLGAELAGASPALVATYAEMAHAYGMALQLVEDCANLFQGPRSRDLASGIRTYPIARHLERLAGQERRRFLALLDQARTDLSAQEQVRRELKDAGILWASALITEIHCQRARRALEAAAPLEPAGSGLRAMIDAKSWFTNQYKEERHES
jgi:geranylgeranyl pyrophosphate synthase